MLAARSRREILLAGSLAVSLSACSSSITLDLSLADDEIAIVATVDEDGRVLYADRILENAIEVAAPTGAQLLVWTLRTDQLVDPEGQPLGVERLAGMLVSGSDAARAGNVGACGRCLVPADAAPHVFQAGDSCPVPGFAKLETFLIASSIETTVIPAPLVERVRSRVRLAFPGACACEEQIPESATANEFEVCGVLPADSPFDFANGAFAVDEAGWLGAFAIRTGLIVAPDGRQFIDQHSEPFEAAARGAVPLATSSVSQGGRFLVFSKGGVNNIIDSRADLVEVVGDELRRTPSVIDPSELISVESAEILVPGRRAILAGKVERGVISEPAIAQLEMNGADFSFVQQPVAIGECPFPPSITTLRRATVTDSGIGVAISYSGRSAQDPGSVFLLPPGSDEWRCAADFPTVYTANGVEGALTELQEVGTINDRFVFVAKGRRNAANEIVSFSLDSTEVTDAGFIDRWSPNLEADTYSSDGFVQTLARVPGTVLLRAVLFENRLIDLFGGLMASQPLVSQLPGFGSVVHKPRGYFTSRSGWEVVRGAASEAFYRRPPGGQAERVYGPSRNISTRPVFPAQGFGPNAVAVFANAEPPALIVEEANTGGCDRFVRRALEMDPPSPSSEHLLSATSLGEGRYLLAGRERAPPETFVLRWVDLNRGAVEGELRVPHVGVLQTSAPGVLLNRNTFLIADQTARVFALSDPARADGRTADEFVQLSSLWDDPETELIEPEPDSTGSSVPGFRALTVSGGVAWATGHNLLARIVPGERGTPPRLEGYWRWRAAEGAFGAFPSFQSDRPRMTAALALCPDRVSFSTDWNAQNLSGSSFFSIGSWKLTPAGECLDGGPEDLAVCEQAFYKAGATRIGSYGGGVTGIYSTPRGLYQLLSNGYLISAAGYHALLYGAIEKSVVDARGRLWFRQGLSERVGVVVPRP